MSELLQAIIIAIVQGLLEFLPVSSSGHTVALTRLLGWDDHGILLDAAVHLGSLAAVALHFRRAIASLFRSRGRTVEFSSDDVIPAPRLLIILAIGTAPLVAAGIAFLFAPDTLLDALRSLLGVGITLIVTGIVLLSTMLAARGTRRLEQIPRPLALAVGIAQAVAVLPGISRSGATLTAALWGGVSRTHAARLTLLLALPALAGAGVLVLIQGLTSGEQPDWLLLAAAAAVSAAVSLISIRLLLAVLQRASVLPFALYALAAGAALVTWAALT